MTVHKQVTRRDFLNGAAIVVSAAGFAPLAAAQTLGGAIREEPYPPSLTGMRGQHPGSFEVAHMLAWNGEAPGLPTETGETYDLVVVGGGLSGLAAAAFFQQARGKNQRILILDNHDDFGGHAKRNEFMVRDRMLLGVGGSINLEEPDAYSPTAKKLLTDIGVDFDRLEQANRENYILSGDLQTSGIFIKTPDGESQTITGRWIAALQGKGDYRSLIDQLPYNQDQKERIAKLVSGEWDYLVGRAIAERASYMATTSYHEFLLDKVGLAPETLSLFEPLLRVNNGVGGDGLSVWEALTNGAPGLRSVGWPWALAHRLLFDENDFYHALLFPDGNASIARLLVRHLIPGIAPGNTMDDITSARFDYRKLDDERGPVRIRLNSTAIRARQDRTGVSVTYVRDGKAFRVRSSHCVLACFNAIIPHLCPELPDEQKEALGYGSKIPLVWASVALREGSPFYRAGAEAFQCPDSYFELVTKAPPINLNDYQTPLDPSDPLVLFMLRSPVPPKSDGQTARDVFRQARYDLLGTPFSTFEAEIRLQLTEMFGPHGFDVDRDIEAITVNRWSHGYAYRYYELDDPKFPEGRHPHEIGRRQFGRISIANTDSEARAYLDAAFDAAWRATNEQLSVRDEL